MSAFFRLRKNLLGATLLGATLLGAASLAGPAIAAPATADGAQKLKDSLARYLGRPLFDKGMITVVPKGEGYNVTIDIDSAKFGDASKDVEFHVGPYSQLVTPQADGTYHVTAEAQPCLVSLKGKSATGEPLEITENVNAMTFDGIFDLNISAFASYKAAAGKTTITINLPTRNMDATIDNITMQADSKPNASGGNDFHAAADFGPMAETIAARPTGQPPLTLVLRNEGAHEDVVMTGADMGKFLEVAAAFVDAGSPDKMIAGQDGLKAKVLAAFPGWQDMTLDLVMQKPSVGTPKGIINAASLEEKIGLSGVVKNGGFSLGLKIAGLALPDGLVPDWAKSSIPGDVDLDMKLTGVDLDGLAHLVVQNFDAAKTPPVPDTLRMPLLMAFMNGKPHVEFSQSLSGPNLDVKGQGETTVVPGAKGHASVSAKGLDSLLAALNPANTPSTQKMLLSLTFLKGLARTGPDGRAVWDVDFDSTAKKVTVNGQSFGSGTR